MKRLISGVLLLAALPGTGLAAVKDVLYQGQEIELNTSKDHSSVVIFPEVVKGVVRGYGADSYVIQHRESDPRILELMPTGSELAEITVSGVSGEQYVLKMMYKEDFHTKVTILPLKSAVAKVQETISDIKAQPSESVIKTEETLPVLNPQAAAAEGKEVQPAPGSEANSTLPAALNARITLKGNGLPLKIYLGSIAQVTGYNVIASTDVEARKVSLNLENIEVWRALKSLLYQFGYGFKVSKEDLIISAVETRLFNIVIPSVDQSFADTTSNESFTRQSSATPSGGSGSASQTNQDVRIGTRIVLENRSANTSVWDDLESNLKSLVTPQSGVFSVNRSSGQIIVSDLPGVLDRVQEFIESYNTILKRQQSFEIQIVEVQLKDQHQSGIDWNALAHNISGVVDLAASTNYAMEGFSGGQVFSLGLKGAKGHDGVNDNGVGAVIKALEEMGRVEVVSRPRVTVSNRVPCILQEGTSKTYISESGQTIANEATTTTLRTSQVHEGLTMRLVARIGEGEEDTILNLTAAISTIDSITDIKSGNVTIQTPQVSNKSLTTNVGVKTGRSLIIGGLISSTKMKGHSGVPGLSRLPFVGGAFKYQQTKDNKTELVIVITPKQ